MRTTRQRIKGTSFYRYLRRYWPGLWAEIKDNSPEERAERLDILTLTRGSIRMDSEIAYARWYRIMQRMYSINRDLLF